MALDRYDRQIGLFGATGQTHIADAAVAIVGLGGLGSHVAQQLAYLGVVDYVLIDDDTVSSSNLNRLIGAVETDAAQDISKVAVAERLIRSVQPESVIVTDSRRLSSPDDSAVLDSATTVFGCVDDDLERLHLTEICTSRAKPYFDLATDVGEESEGDAWYGGRVVFSDAAPGCLVCRGVLNQRAMARASMTAGQRTEDDRVYGVHRRDLHRTGPAVVSLNGVISSLAVTEFMAWVTKLREPWRHLTYRGDLGRVTLNKDEPQANCYYCEALWAADV